MKNVIHYIQKVIRVSAPVFFIVIWTGLFLSSTSAAELNPKVGIVISDASYEQDRSNVQMSSRGWAAVANLAGVPYNTLFLEELDAYDLSQFSALIFTQCGYVSQDVHDGMANMIEGYLSGGGNVIVDGHFSAYDEEGNPRAENEIYDLLEIEPSGMQGDNNFRIKIGSNRHFITRPFEQQQFVTQHLVEGLNILDFVSGSQSKNLLEHSDENESYPFLSVRQTGNNRVVLVSDFATRSGAPSFFRNQHPQVFYKNQLYEIMIRTLHWSVYGDIQHAFPTPQLTNAGLTAIIRLDGDVSSNLEAQIGTFDYLTDFARETGVVSVYAWVSSGATRAGWETLAPYAEKLEAFGGRIGTHSKYHRIDYNMNEERWEEELGGAIEEIETNMAEQGYPVKVEHFINPGNGIPMKDFEQISRRFTLHMTHGFQESVPLAFGDMSWYTGSQNLVVLDNISSPDYQWFNDPNWSYTTAQVTAYQEAVADHMYNNVGRGVLYNQMWHDYAITTQPQGEKERIVNESNIALYDALKAKFKTLDIYAADPVDLTYKFRAMAQWDYNWHTEGNQLVMNLDLSDVHHPETAEYTGGMGIRINNSRQSIQSVTINGASHHAFHDDLIILPNLNTGSNRIVVQLGDNSPDESRLIYVSKRMPRIEKRSGSLEAEVLTKSKAKFAFLVKEPSILLNADEQEWDRLGDYTLRGYVTSDRKLILKSLDHHEVMITKTASRITNADETDSYLSLAIEADNDEDSELFAFQSKATPVSVQFNGRELDMMYNGKEYSVSLPDMNQQSELRILY
ncbi:MAG: hypothetical protein WD097_02410 [Balneolales bacterium]